MGVDWARGDPEPLFAKLDEEIGEFKEAIGEGDARHMEEELGDVLFMTVNLARYFKIDPDAALSRVCEKFKARFQLMERMAAEEERNGGKPLSGRTLDEQGALWDRAKERLSGSGQPEESC